MIRNLSAMIDPAEDRIFSMGDLSKRWGIHRKVALQRAKKLNIPIVRFNERSLGVKLSDVLEAERDATVESRLTTPKQKNEETNITRSAPYRDYGLWLTPPPGLPDTSGSR
jgi:hypothetical protein